MRHLQKDSDRQRCCWGMHITPSGAPALPGSAQARLLARFSPLLLCTAVVAFGLLHLVYGAFVTRVVPSTGITEQAGAAAPYLVGTLLSIAGVLMLRPPHAYRVALLLAALLAVSFGVLHLPTAWVGPAWGGAWTSAFKALALSGGCLALAASTSRPIPGSPVAQRWALLGRVFFSAFLLLGGIQHFIWATFVAALIPTWIPAPAFWVYFAGAALIAGAVGMLVPVTLRVAALWTGIMIFLWVWLLHVPRAVADLGNTNETVAAFEALAFAGTAWLICRNATSQAPGELPGEYTFDPLSSAQPRS